MSLSPFSAPVNLSFPIPHSQPSPQPCSWPRSCVFGAYLRSHCTFSWGLGSSGQGPLGKSVAPLLTIGHHGPRYSGRPNVTPSRTFEPVASGDVRIVGDTHFRARSLPG